MFPCIRQDTTIGTRSARREPNIHLWRIENGAVDFITVYIQRLLRKRNGSRDVIGLIQPANPLLLESLHDDFRDAQGCACIMAETEHVQIQSNNAAFSSTATLGRPGWHPAVASSLRAARTLNGESASQSRRERADAQPPFGPLTYS
jgi:hypothetical protein